MRFTHPHTNRPQISQFALCSEFSSAARSTNASAFRRMKLLCGERREKSGAVLLISRPQARFATLIPPFLVWGRSIEALASCACPMLPHAALPPPPPMTTTRRRCRRRRPRRALMPPTPALFLLFPLLPPSSLLSPLPPLLLLGSLVATLVVAAAVPSPPRVLLVSPQGSRHSRTLSRRRQCHRPLQ